MKKKLVDLDAFSDDQREVVGGHLAWEFGFEHKLPDDHDFKWGPPVYTVELSNLVDDLMYVYNLPPATRA